MPKPSLKYLFACMLVALQFMPGAGREAAAQGFPDGQVTVIVAGATGGFLDISGRIIADAVTKRTGTSVILDFRPGGGGTIALQALKQANPDGHTLLMGHSATHTINPAISSDLPYDPIADFAPVTSLVYTPTVFVVPTDSPVETLDDLAELADSKPEGLSFGSAGVGTSSHVVGEMFKVATGKKFIHVPYKGSGPMMIDLVEGRLDFTSTSYSAVKGQIEEGRLRPIAVPADQRIEQLPDVPTTAEAGYPTVKLDYWAGLFAPAGTPAETVQAISEAFNETLNDPEIVKELGERALAARGNSPEEFKKQIEAELTAMKEVVEAAQLGQ